MTLDHSIVAFLNELTRRHEHLLVWKHLDRALQGRGDIDAAAPEGETAAIAADAVSIAADTLSASHVIHCDHVADKRLQFFVQPERLPQLFEFDLCVQPSRGFAPWADPHSMVPLAIVGVHGIRHLRPGAEAVVSLVYHGISWRGQDKLAGDERQIVEKGLADDLEGVYDACRTLPPGPARSPLLVLIENLCRGTWSRRYAQHAFSGFVLGGLARPAFAARRGMYRAHLAVGRECLMSRLARSHDRRVPAGGVDALLDAARAGGHEIRML
jgi:hypothetical protein